MRLIDADALQTALVNEYTSIAGYKTRVQFYKAIEILRHQPTITYGSPLAHGRWDGESDGYTDGEPVIDVWYCSKCGYCLDEGIELQCENGFGGEIVSIEAKGKPPQSGGPCDNHQSAKLPVTTLAIQRARASGPG